MTTLSEDETKYLRIIWAMMLEEGRPTNGDWDYYLGNFDHEGRRHPSKYPELIEQTRETAAKVGINLEASGLPVYETKSSFADTDSPSIKVEVLLGTLVLLDGTKVMMGLAEPEKAVTEAVKHLQARKLGNTESTKIQDAVNRYFP